MFLRQKNSSLAPQMAYKYGASFVTQFVFRMTLPFTVFRQEPDARKDYIMYNIIPITGNQGLPTGEVVFENK